MFLPKTFHDFGRAKKKGAVISRIQPYLPHFKIELIATVVLNSTSVNLGQLKDKRLPVVVPHTTPLSHLCTAIMCACHHTHTHTSHTPCTQHTHTTYKYIIHTYTPRDTTYVYKYSHVCKYPHMYHTHHIHIPPTGTHSTCTCRLHKHIMYTHTIDKCIYIQITHTILSTHLFT